MPAPAGKRRFQWFRRRRSSMACGDRIWRMRRMRQAASAMSRPTARPSGQGDQSVQAEIGDTPCN
jgi:hypothetical protein